MTVPLPDVGGNIQESQFLEFQGEFGKFGMGKSIDIYIDYLLSLTTGMV